MAIKKQNDFNTVKKKFSTSAKYKSQRFFDLGSHFLDAVGLPGPAIGHINMFLRKVVLLSTQNVIMRLVFVMKYSQTMT